MRKLHKDESGFGAVEIILVLIIVGLLGVVGWMVYNNHKTTNSTANTPITQPAKANTPAPVATDPMAGWAAYSSTSGKFSLKYPKTWVTATHPELCGDGLLLLGANSNSVGKCGSEGFGQISVSGEPERAPCTGLSGDAWTTDSTETVTISDVSGTKISGTAKAPAAQGSGTVPEGTKLVQYCFISNNKIYIADYTQLSTYPDVLTDFNLMVTKTLKFE